MDLSKFRAFVFSDWTFIVKRVPLGTPVHHWGLHDCGTGPFRYGSDEPFRLPQSMKGDFVRPIMQTERERALWHNAAHGRPCIMSEGVYDEQLYH